MLVVFTSTGNGKLESVNGLKCFSKYPPYSYGYYMEAADCPGATLRNSTLKDPNIVCCILDTAMIPSIPPNIHVSLQAYLNMVGDTTRTRALYPFYMQALSDAGMTSKREIAAFTSQVLYQTSGMKYSEENTYGQEYKGKKNLGNSNKADARKYISRGFLPLIGKHMYRLAKYSVNDKITRQPELVALPSVGFKVAAWLWLNGYSSADNSSVPTGNLGKFCNGTEYSFVELSINVQQDTAGIETLFQYWRHSLKVLGLPCPSEGKGPRCSQGKKEGWCKLVTSCKGEYSTTGCPGPSPITCCLDCRNSIDLAFVLDSSGSVRASNFQLGLQFIIRVCQYFDIAYPHGTRVALIRYHTLPTIMFSFNTYIKKQDVLDAISDIPYQAGGTRTDKALLEAL
ncbi:dendrite reproteinration [Desmophyllum pertusum]|uniref:Dendrite reproteinration n=1 Tax=Desmophyllum pertusum TaxID=174260 RepID=A0A9W9YFF5_9CNID|nr:dendrite reproteinration [Desmophyllum pertusum]